jgi:hypothetical protein
MPVLAAFALANLKHDIAWLWGVITHASFWQLAFAAMAAWMLVVQFEWADAKHDRDSYLKQRDDYKHQLDSISTEQNEQAVQTKTRIVSVIKTIHDADERAKVVEQAAPAKDCKTKPEVLQADL